VPEKRLFIVLVKKAAMKESEFSFRILQKLNEFETMENIQPSEEWNQLLMKKLSTARSNSVRGMSAVKFAVAALLILLINIGFILNTVIRDSKQLLRHDSELQIISKEFLINPATINN
jgi:hypothetical protein